MKNAPLYKARRTLHTGADLLTDKQKIRLDAVFGNEEHVEVEATWGASTSASSPPTGNPTRRRRGR